MDQIKVSGGIKLEDLEMREVLDSIEGNMLVLNFGSFKSVKFLRETWYLVNCGSI